MRFLGKNEESLSSRSDSGIDIEDHSGAPLLSEKSKGLNHGKGDDPLSDPQVRRSLLELNISGPQLMDMSVKELNKRLVNCSPSMIDMLKRCRRTLKNRGYAKSCRVKRIAAKVYLEQVNRRLVRENRELKKRNRSLEEQVVQLQNKTSYQQERLTDQPTHRHHPTQLINFNDGTHNLDIYRSDIKHELPVDEHDSELLSLYECADSYPSGVELDQIAQSISADGSLLQSWI